MSRREKEETPPGWAMRFFRWYCNDHLSEAVLGDLLELYARRCKTLGKRKADLMFAWNVVLFFQPFAMRKRSRHQIHSLMMLPGYFKITWRTIARQKMYSIIKIGGFAIGLASCILIALFIQHELRYDNYYPDKERIYRVYNERTAPEKEKWTAFPPSMAPLLKSNFPEVELAGRLIPYHWFNARNNLFRRDDQIENTFEEGFAYADQELLDILQIPMVYGNRSNALAKPYTIVMSRRKAERYFPNEDPVGKVVILNEDKSTPYVIGGVIENLPSISHLHQFDFFITLTEKEFWPGEQASWCCWNYNPYIKLRPGTDVKAFEKKMLSIRDNQYLDFLRQTENKSFEEVKKYHFFRLQPISDIHLYSEGISDEIPHGDIKYVWLFGGIACFILLLACINFINLSTAKSANRAKEVGLRKVVGSVRSYLVKQFLTESILYSMVSFIFGIILAWMSLSFFNRLAGTTLSMPWTSWWLAPLFVGAAIIVGVIAGIYPSFYLSSFKPIDVLKGAVRRGSKSASLRSALVIFQFTTSIFLIIGTFIIYKQMQYFLNAKIGYDKEQILTIQGANTLGDKRDVFKEELQKLAYVKSVTISSYLPVSNTQRDQNPFWKEGRSKVDKPVGAQKWSVDKDYIATMGMKIAEGRNFIPEMASDSQAVIINQTMAHHLGLKKPIGERIGNGIMYTVIGVVEDFNFDGMKGKIMPLCFVLGEEGSIASIKVQADNMQDIIMSVKKVWDKLMPNQPFRYAFMDESYARMYEDVQRIGYLFGGFAILAIIVACLGLFALSAFMIEQRNKEVSIRLALGASVKSIFGLLTGNFVKLVIISFIIAVPVGWFVMQIWLQEFAYRIEITWDIFIAAGFVSLAIALLTVSYQSFRAALANPAQNLRSE
jgi:putative ABC transport system permease protein